MPPLVYRKKGLTNPTNSCGFVGQFRDYREILFELRCFCRWNPFGESSSRTHEQPVKQGRVHLSLQRL
jgi:hypothetical protein